MQHIHPQQEVRGLHRSRPLGRGVLAKLGRQLRGELFTAPLNPVLHPSPWRLRYLGLFTLLGHPLFAWIWGSWLPQPYENYWLRCIIGMLGLILLSARISGDPTGKLTGRAFGAVFWIQLPLFFSWMYLCNHGNTVWLASCCAMILIYYHVTDWRIATLGIVSGGLLAWLLFALVGPVTPAMPQEQAAVNAVVIAFSWSGALLLGVSSANLRREHLNHTLTTMGIMAHELRTPLATMSLIGDALRNESLMQGRAEPGGDTRPDKLDKLAARLHTLVRNMNHQIDTQITNARLLRLPGHTEVVSAAGLVQGVLRDYPYRNMRERESVVVQVRRDFEFESSNALFSQVIDNLVKNAFRSLAAASTTTQPGDLLVEVGTLQNRGRIIISDRGVGIDAELQKSIFEPFFSTDKGTGHGLGLAFCKRVVQGASGSIRVKSSAGRGAVFTIDLPLLQ